MNSPVDHSSRSLERIAIFLFGAMFTIVCLILAIYFPNPSPFQYIVFQIGSGLVYGRRGHILTRVLVGQVHPGIRAGGAIAVFILIFLINPAALLSNSNESSTNVSKLDAGKGPMQKELINQQLEKPRKATDSYLEPFTENFNDLSMHRWVMGRVGTASLRTRYIATPPSNNPALGSGTDIGYLRRPDPSAELL